MRNDISYGIVPLKRKRGGGWQVLIICHQSGFWAFPKGHAEPGETPQETALREMHEETGLNLVQFVAMEPLTESYFFVWEGEKIHKTVIYYAAEVKCKIKIQEEELTDAKWVDLVKAESFMTYPEAKKICQKVLSQLIN
jgi:bis(5'-nucleosidyl)-tetraphosphatase